MGFLRCRGEHFHRHIFDQISPAGFSPDHSLDQRQIPLNELPERVFAAGRGVTGKQFTIGHNEPTSPNILHVCEKQDYEVAAPWLHRFWAVIE